MSDNYGWKSSQKRQKPPVTDSTLAELNRLSDFLDGQLSYAPRETENVGSVDAALQALGRVLGYTPKIVTDVERERSLSFEESAAGLTIKIGGGRTLSTGRSGRISLTP